MGVLLLNNYGKYIARRRAIELGLVILGILLVILTVAGPVSRFLSGVGQNLPLVDLSMLTSLVAVVVALAFLAGICYGIVAISAQVQLQEDIPPDGRGRVFGVLNMLISVASILPIIIVGPIADWLGTTSVILAVAGFVLVSGLFSIVVRGPIRAGEVAGPHPGDHAGLAAGPDRRQPARAAAPAARALPSRGARHGEAHRRGRDAPRSGADVDAGDEPRRGHLHRRDDQHGRRRGGGREGPDARRRRDPRPRAGHRGDRGPRGHRPRANAREPLHVRRSCSRSEARFAAARRIHRSTGSWWSRART